QQPPRSRQQPAFPAWESFEPCLPRGAPSRLRHYRTAGMNEKPPCGFGLHPSRCSNSIFNATELDKAFQAFGRHKGVIESAWQGLWGCQSEVIRASRESEA